MNGPPQKPNRLPRAFYDRQADIVARDLIGKALLRCIDGQWLGGRIVETEAYLAEGDPSSHSHRGRTSSNASMFQHAGTLYVYPIHAKYCLNAVTEKSGRGSAVLIRAIEPVWGLEKMVQHRGTTEHRQLTRGPARLCQALAVDRDLDGEDLLTSAAITIANIHHPANDRPPSITSSRRIGISSARERLLRFFEDGNWYVSGRVSDHRRRPVRPADTT